MPIESIDKKILWHPFTQQSEWEQDRFGKPLVIAKGKGVHLYDVHGKKYLDAVSSLWANLHGHRHPAIDRAVRRQLEKMAHSTFLGLTHEPAIRLAQALIQIVPKGLSRVFYSDNGSTAVEVALKMAYQHHLQNDGGHQAGKRSFLALRNSYHGDTIGSVSVGGIDLFHKKFRPLLFKTRFAMSPHCRVCLFNKKQTSSGGDQKKYFYHYRGEQPKPGDFRQETGCRWECLGNAEKILKKNHAKIAAAVIEPTVQGAGGMIVMPAGYLWGFARLCKKYNVPWIADEVAAGFGRTGKMFACEQEKVSPDFLCLSKGITGGYLPLAATITTEKIYRSFLGRHEEFKTFFHGHTYTANPLACAASLASIKIFKTEKVLTRMKKIAVLMKSHLKEIALLRHVGEVRQTGLMAGIQFVKNDRTFEPFPIAQQTGKKICAELREDGILMRPLGDVLVLMPPLSINEKELGTLMNNIKKRISSLEKNGHAR